MANTEAVDQLKEYGYITAMDSSEDIATRFNIGGGGEQVQADWDQTDDTAPDFIKNKPTIPAAQIQSDWDQADSEAVDFIKNKPEIPDGAVIKDTYYNEGYEVWCVDSINLAKALAAGKPAYVHVVSGTQVSGQTLLTGYAPVLNTETYDICFYATTGDIKNSFLVWASGAEEGMLQKVPAPSFTQKQADWNQTNSSAVDYIKNKPSISSFVTIEGYFDSNDFTPNDPDEANKAYTAASNGKMIKLKDASTGDYAWVSKVIESVDGYTLCFDSPSSTSQSYGTYTAHSPYGS